MRTPGLINAPDHYMDQAQHMRNVKNVMCATNRCFWTPKSPNIGGGKKRKKKGMCVSWNPKKKVTNGKWPEMAFHYASAKK
jgi:hypothetical protein